MRVCTVERPLASTRRSSACQPFVARCSRYQRSGGKRGGSSGGLGTSAASGANGRGTAIARVGALPPQAVTNAPEPNATANATTGRRTGSIR